MFGRIFYGEPAPTSPENALDIALIVPSSVATGREGLGVGRSHEERITDGDRGDLQAEVDRRMKGHECRGAKPGRGENAVALTRHQAARADPDDTDHNREQQQEGRQADLKRQLEIGVVRALERRELIVEPVIAIHRENILKAAQPDAYPRV